MSTSEISPTSVWRPLEHERLAEARALAASRGAEGIYVCNALDGADFTSGRDQVFEVVDAGGLRGLAYFGARGNLIVVERDGIDAQRLASQVRASGVEWRIALGREGVVAALARLESRPPLVDREQMYYAIRPGEVSIRSSVVRPATRRDARALMRAALDLNESDLNVARWRVNRSWLRETVRRRIREGRTFVIGPPGAPVCKLDVGSFGAAGAVVEGVYTAPEERGRGHAVELLAGVFTRALIGSPVVCLHVAVTNTSARRAYERVGMAPAGACRLLLRG